MTRRLITPVVATAAVAAVLAGCSEDDPPLPRVEPTSTPTSTPTTDRSTSGGSSVTTSTPTTEPAGWTPDLPADAPKPTPLNPRQKKTYDEAVDTFETHSLPLLRRLLRHPVPAAQARKQLRPYFAGTYLPFAIKGINEFYARGASGRHRFRFMWRSPQTVTSSRVVWDECTEARGAIYVDGEPFEPPSTSRRVDRVTLVKKDGDWYVTSGDGVGPC